MGTWFTAQQILNSMSIFKRISQLFKRKPKDKFPQLSRNIKEAFVSDGVTYYEFDDAFNIPCERAMKRITFYAEATMRVDYEYLQAHVEACDKIFNSQKIDIYKLKLYNDYLRDRMKWIVDTDLVYKLASIVYFDESEDPREYDHAYNAKKIERWKRSMKVHDFFYSAPILRLIPYLKDVDVNLEEYSKVVALTKGQMLTNISSN